MKENNFPREIPSFLKMILSKELSILQKKRVLEYNFAKLLGMQRLWMVFLSPSRQCNLECKHCYEISSENERVSDYMTTEETKTVLRKILDLHVCWVVFCSGEFLLRKDSFELVSFARSLGLCPIIVTNGTTINTKTLRKLKESGIHELIFSLDNARKEEHDSNRGMKGLFDKVIAGIKTAKSFGIPVRIWTFTMKNEAKKIAELEALGRKLGVLHVYTFFTTLSGKLFNSFEKNLTFDEREELRKLFNNSDKIILEFPHEKSLCSGMGNLHINILPNGAVTGCPPLPYSYGNIWNEDIKKIHKRIEKDFLKFPSCTGQCIVNFKEYRENTSASFIKF